MKCLGICCALLLFASTAGATIPDLTPSTVTTDGGHVWITPDGSGPTLAEVGATITVTLIESASGPIPNFPFQDIWVHDDGTGELSICQGGSTADHNTDASGVTTISGAIAGGGATQSGLRVYVAGTPIGSNLPIDVSSPEYNGDLVINIADLGEFASDYINAQYDFHADFDGDGVENLADLGIFAAVNGTGCP
jgi:hypothetical protein